MKNFDEIIYYFLDRVGIIFLFFFLGLCSMIYMGLWHYPFNLLYSLYQDKYPDEKAYKVSQSTLFELYTVFGGIAVFLLILPYL